MTDDSAREILERLRKREDELRGPIIARIEQLRKGPETLHFELTFDKENGVWLGRQRWSDGPARTAEGATPAEVLRKLADKLE